MDEPQNQFDHDERPGRNASHSIQDYPQPTLKSNNLGRRGAARAPSRLHRHAFDQIRRSNGDAPCRSPKRDDTTCREVEKPNIHEVSPYPSLRPVSWGNRTHDESINVHDRTRHHGRTTTRKWRKPGQNTTTRRTPAQRQSRGWHSETHQKRETKLLGQDSDATYLYLLGTLNSMSARYNSTQVDDTTVQATMTTAKPTHPTRRT